jgi:transposase
LEHANEYLIYPENIEESLSIDEVSLSKGELYTVLTNKRTKQKNKKSLVAIINGTDSCVIQKVLNKIPQATRDKVLDISLDMARNMNLIATTCFPNAKKSIDRFHVIRLVLDAMQHVRVKTRWAVIKSENRTIDKMKKKKQKYKPKVLENGDTLKELLARSKYLLYRLEDDWTYKQRQRANILFKKFPKIKKAYYLSLEFRSIYLNKNLLDAKFQFSQWKIDIECSKIEEFNSTLHSLEYHQEEIFNYFHTKSTNGYAESFNSKIKNFRANLRGVTDIKFFLFRLEKLFA